MNRLLFALFISSLIVGGCEQNGGSLTKVQYALTHKDFSKARALAESVDGSDARFIEGISCYRLQDYACAAQMFSQAAWTANNKTARARAVFNLANTYFKVGDFDQAAVLFRDAKILGITDKQVRTNLDISLELANALRKRQTDIDEFERRAVWRANATKRREGFEDTLTTEIYLGRPAMKSAALRALSDSELNALLSSGAKIISSETSSESRRFWIKSTEQAKPESTAKLMTRLFSMETGFPGVQKEPRELEGQRQW